MEVKSQETNPLPGGPQHLRRSDPDERFQTRRPGDEREAKAELENFFNPESRSLVIVTSSKLLTNGVNAQNCKLVALDQRILSMTEFKQFVGCGTRINEDFDKYWFIIMDLKKATELFADPAFDGDPVQNFEPQGDRSPVPPDDPGLPGDDAAPPPESPLSPEPPGEGRVRYVIGGEIVVYVVAKRVQYYGPDGRLITDSLRNYTRPEVHREFASLDDFLHRWSSAGSRPSSKDSKPRACSSKRWLMKWARHSGSPSIRST